MICTHRESDRYVMMYIWRHWHVVSVVHIQDSHWYLVTCTHGDSDSDMVMYLCRLGQLHRDVPVRRLWRTYIAVGILPVLPGPLRGMSKA